MAGRFLIAKYETDDGVIRPIRIQPETIIPENPEPAGGITNDTYIRVSGSKRAYGFKARFVTLSRQVGTVDDYSGATVYARVPVLLASALILLVKGATIAYQGVDWTIVSKSKESNR